MNVFPLTRTEINEKPPDDQKKLAGTPNPWTASRERPSSLVAKIWLAVTLLDASVFLAKRNLNKTDIGYGGCAQLPHT